jgi:hypothetical protein
MAEVNLLNVAMPGCLQERSSFFKHPFLVFNLDQHVAGQDRP